MAEAIWVFDLVSLCNGISTFKGYLMPRHPCSRILEVLFNHLAGENLSVHAFSKIISPKMNVIAQSDFETAYHYVAEQYF